MADKQMLWGPILIPNKLILRKDKNDNPFYIFFDAETIEIIATKYNENKINDIFNFQHSDRKVDATLIQNWLVSAIDKSQEFEYDLPVGTWFGGVKVKDKNFWLNDVKSGKVKGFSVEVRTDNLELVNMAATSEEEKNKTKQMEKEIKLGKAVLQGGTEVYWDGEFGMGTVIYVDEALTELAPDAEHILEDGTKVTTKEGIVTEIEVSSVDETEEELSGDLLESVKPMFEDLKKVIAELSERLDKLENKPSEDVSEKLSKLEDTNAKIEELEKKIVELSSLPSVKSITELDDRQKLASQKEESTIDRIISLRKMMK